MKLVAVLGSPHGMQGNTAAVLKSVMNAASAKGTLTKTFSLTDYTIHPCKGCATCSKTGKCVIDDDFATILKSMLDADGIILASPNHAQNVSAQSKALIDRCYSPLHCQMLQGKYGAAVVTSGGPLLGVCEEYLLTFSSNIGCWKAGSICAVKMQLIDKDERSQVMESAAELGRNIVSAIQSKKAFPEQEAQRSQNFEYMKAVVQMEKDSWPYDYEYWKSNWGLKE
jgi:multimeric flavodoxin WrbA